MHEPAEDRQGNEPSTRGRRLPQLGLGIRDRVDRLRWPGSVVIADELRDDAADEEPVFPGTPRATGISAAGSTAPDQTEALAVPGDHRLRLDHDQGALPARP